MYFFFDEPPGRLRSVRSAELERLHLDRHGDITASNSAKNQKIHFIVVPVGLCNAKSRTGELSCYVQFPGSSGQSVSKFCHLL